MVPTASHVLPAEVGGTDHADYVHEEPRIPFILRVLWFFVVGWHVTLWWVLLAWLFNITVLGLPVGLWMLNRVPLVLTLRTQRGYTRMQVENGRVYRSSHENVSQLGWLLRLVYFILIGWWFSLIWSVAGWLLCVSIFGLPVGVLMLNRLPAVTTLMRH